MALGKKRGEAAAAGEAAAVESWRTGSAGFGARLSSTLCWIAGSSLSFAALTVPRRKEWFDVCLDYMYVKRTQYAPNVYASLWRWLKNAPK
ncbi:hypothetical protein ETH_00020955 [Eimeria tenella]|uniref:Uncharacterized protein n=1 Tax=Eimeria tenella TaxID=5802 RepID=U6KV76_EIMTE|nr:hypothetical protein ETH_00020955 [Eimeria tenella]CDJ40264.1 hypothetical protein ETH_00020955 [Eimeria tenella]|eukprot:XP_013231017.1 hypothetical protein ETH_00020955 [Eimeria tenella]